MLAGKCKGFIMFEPQQCSTLYLESSLLTVCIFLISFLNHLIKCVKNKIMKRLDPSEKVPTPMYFMSLSALLAVSHAFVLCAKKIEML